MRDGKKLPEQISPEDIQDDEKLLLPVLPNDAFIMSLDDLPASSGAAEGSNSVAADEATQGKSAADIESNTAALQATIEDLTRQFANYRFAVEQTLDKRWHADDEPSQSSSGPEKENKDESQLYWESYASHGMLQPIIIKNTLSFFLFFSYRGGGGGKK